MGSKKKGQSEERTIENRKARFDYHIGDTLEVGIALRGSEVKAIRDGRVSITEGYVAVREQPLSLELMNVNIEEFAPAGALGHRPKRSRALLAHAKEIRKLARAVEQKGMTVVPLKLYFKDGWAKLLIGVAKGKQAHDKRQAIGDRDMKRDLERAMSRKRL